MPYQYNNIHRRPRPCQPGELTGIPEARCRYISYPKSRQDRLVAAGGEAEAQLEQRRAELPTSKEIQGYAADFREFLMVR